MYRVSDKVLAQARKTKGYLEKKSTNFFASWQPRYFIIIDNTLAYYGDEALGKAKKTIKMSYVLSVQGTGEREFTLFTNRRLYNLRSPTEENRDLWVASISILKSFYAEREAKIEGEGVKRKSHKRMTSNSKDIKRVSGLLKRDYLTPDKKRERDKEKDRYKDKYRYRYKYRYKEKEIINKDMTLSYLFSRVCLPKIREILHLPSMLRKIIFLQHLSECYFIISCKTIEYSYCDEELLEPSLVHPYEYNVLYYYEMDKRDNQQVHQLCKCGDIITINVDGARLKLCCLGKKGYIYINCDHLSAQDIESLAKKMTLAAEIGKEYHNEKGIQLRRNIDRSLYLYDRKYITLVDIVRQYFQKNVLGRAKTVQANSKSPYFFLLCLKYLKASFTDLMNCVLVKQSSRNEFLTEFAKSYNELTFIFLSKQWRSLQEVISNTYIKKLVVVLGELDQLVKEFVEDERLKEGAIVLVRILLERYEVQFKKQLTVAIELYYADLIDKVTNEEDKLADKYHQFYQQYSLLYQYSIVYAEQLYQQLSPQSSRECPALYQSHKVIRKLRTDMSLILHELSYFPLSQHTIWSYCRFFVGILRTACLQLHEMLDKCKLYDSILGACNELQRIKHDLLADMRRMLVKELLGILSRDSLMLSNKESRTIIGRIKSECINYIENDINALYTVLVKKLFVMTFKYIDRRVLNPKFYEINVDVVCGTILNKVGYFTNINRYVRYNLQEASFEEICFFYYTCVIKCDRNKSNEITTEFALKKLRADIGKIKANFQGILAKDKVYVHLKDLNLLRDFIQCDLALIKNLCKQLKKYFGNSFNYGAVRNLMNMRSMNQYYISKKLNECYEVIKHSAETAEDMSLISRYSSLETCNQTRSRYSTLTLSLNEFNENHQIRTETGKRSFKRKEGYLISKKLVKGVMYECKSYFRIRNSHLLEYQNDKYLGEATCYDLQYLKKCTVDPENTYQFILDLAGIRVHLAAETDTYCKYWVKVILEYLSSMSVKVDSSKNKSKIEELFSSGLKDGKDMSTMETKYVNVSPSHEKPRSSIKKINPSHYKPTLSLVEPNNNSEDYGLCGKCSRGFF